MIRKIYLVLVLALPSYFCFGQAGTTASAAADPNAPVMSFETKEHDFGTFEQDGNGTYLFIFTNTGKEPLVIKEARGSCGCTVPHWPQHPVAAGSKDTIRVTYDTHRVGVFVKTVTITSNAKESPDVLTIKGKTTAKPAAPAFSGNRDNSGGAPFTNNWDNQ
jgi:hypothetical protein